MSYYIYNMGIPVRVDANSLTNKNQIQPLNALMHAANVTRDKQDKPQTSHKISQYVQDRSRQQVFNVEQIMTKNPKCLYDYMTFDQAWKQFTSATYRHYPVLNKQEQLVGIISDRDMLRYSAKQVDKKQKLEKLMSAPVLTATNKAAIREICLIMFNQHIGAIPIVVEQGELTGIVTRSDILKSMIENAPMELWI